MKQPCLFGSLERGPVSAAPLTISDPGRGRRKDPSFFFFFFFVFVVVFGVGLGRRGEDAADAPGPDGGGRVAGGVIDVEKKNVCSCHFDDPF